MQNSFYISKPFIFAPGLESKEDLCLFANNKKEILLEKTSPSLSYTSPLFRRRLSQVSKMTVEVVHQLLEETKIATNTKIVFVSFRGELEREFKLNKSIIQDKAILPAGFSLSVFNTPVALATIAFNLKGGYNTIFPSNNNFKDGLLCAASSILSGTQEKIIFIYADELILEEYKNVEKTIKPPLAFSFIISKSQIPEFLSVEYSPNEICENVYKFIQLHINKCYN